MYNCIFIVVCIIIFEYIEKDILNFLITPTIKEIFFNFLDFLSTFSHPKNYVQIAYIKKDIFCKIDKENILQRFQIMKT